MEKIRFQTRLRRAPDVRLVSGPSGWHAASARSMHRYGQRDASPSKRIKSATQAREKMRGDRLHRNNNPTNPYFPPREILWQLEATAWAKI